MTNIVSIVLDAFFSLPKYQSYFRFRPASMNSLHVAHHTHGFEQQK